jgi:DNA-directed RNA polymerase subunit RPC12/RpoP
MKTIGSINIHRMPEQVPDYSFIGKYVEEFEPGVVCVNRCCSRDCLKKGQVLFERNECPHTKVSAWFLPYAGGLPVENTPEYLEYAKQDLERMQELEGGEVEALECWAQALIKVNGIPQTVLSLGIHNVFSDDEETLQKVEKEELQNLTEILLELGFSKEEVEEVQKNMKHYLCRACGHTAFVRKTEQKPDVVIIFDGVQNGALIVQDQWVNPYPTSYFCVDCGERVPDVESDEELIRLIQEKGVEHA